MKKLKFLFVAVVLTLFVGISQSSAQGAEVLRDVVWEYTGDALDGQHVTFYLSSARVTTPIGTINSVYWGELPDPENYDGPKVVVVDAGTDLVYGNIIWKFIVKKDGSVLLIAQTKQVKEDDE